MEIEQHINNTVSKVPQPVILTGGLGSKWRNSCQDKRNVMEMVTATISKGSDTNTRPQNPDVLLRQRPNDRARFAEAVQGSPFATGTVEYVPSRYMVLISRIDNMLRKGHPEPEAIEQLSHLLSEKISAMNEHQRRNLQELPPLRALGVDNLVQLPRSVAGHLHAGTQSDTVLDLLRAPTFAAAIKDESRTTTYGPRGILRAS